LVAVNKSREAKYDVILLDLDMPIMNGYEACKRIREGGREEIKELMIVRKKKQSK
jgi:CheY-like chemotaxis protein